MIATRLIVTVIGILVISGFAVNGVYGETTITVDDSGGADYTSIQEAVYNANDGDTILVHAGTYTENVDVKKQLTIKSESGNPDDTIVHAANPNDHVFYVTADNVTISDFRVTGANGIGKHGIHLEGVVECAVINNIVSNNWCGIYLLDSRKNTLRDNTVKSNNNYGIFLVKSGNNNMNNNTVNSNNRYGIALDTSDNNNLSDNTVHSNDEHGIALVDHSSHNRMRNNRIFNNTYNFGGFSGSINDIDTSNTVDGKQIYYLVGVSDATIDSSSNAGTVCCINCQNISIKDLTLKNNVYGICLHNTIDSNLDNITASNNRYGIDIRHSDHNNLNNNTANANEWEGIIIRHSRYNTLNNNNVFKNKVGINVLHSSQYNELSNNTASNNSVGIEQALSDNNNLTGNVISKNRCGIFLYKCNSNEITGNTLNSNSDCGIHLRYSDNNDMSNNTVRSSRLGIHLVDYSSNNTLKGNFLSNNSEGIKAAGNSDNQIYNNEISDRDILQTPSYDPFFGSSPLNREVIDRHGKLPPLETEEQKQNWSDSLEELGKRVITGTNGRTGLFPNYLYPNGKVLSCGENSLGYFVVVFYKNLTMEKQLIYEIYTIIDENAKDMGIEEVPVEFESAVFRYDGGYVDVLANLKEKQKIPLEEYMNRESASYRPDVIATYGKLPEIETEEQCWRWFHRDTPAIMHGSRDRMDPYFTDGILVSCGPYIDGYIEVTIYENLTIETQPIMDEIYGIIDEEAKKIGISDVPVVFFEGEFVRTDPL
ncbi:MAG: NosD domain-containing protein, partial [Euryarchaeota archaeon]|nr:NosD domain-containing protein [Euryarchaeota archaeon]